VWDGSVVAQVLLDVVPKEIEMRGRDEPKTERVKGPLAHAVDLSGALVKIALPLGYGHALIRVKKALVEEGFELTERVLVSEVIEEQLGLASAPASALVLVDGVLAFQAELLGDEAGLFFPLVVLVRAMRSNRTNVSFRSAREQAAPSSNPLVRLVAEQSQARVIRALEQVASRAASDASLGRRR
jgi:uncharacterized protein (DUF302 family)